MRQRGFASTDLWIALGVAAAVALGAWLIWSTAFAAGVAERDAAWLARDNAELRAANAKIARLNREAREKESQHQQALAAVSAGYQEDLKHAEDQKRRDVAAARAGTVRLRDALATCNATRGSGARESIAAAGGRDAAAGAELSPAATEFLLGLANDADAVARQLTRAQDLVREYYRACQ